MGFQRRQLESDFLPRETAAGSRRPRTRLRRRRCAMILGSLQPVHPAMNVVRFEHTVRDDAAAAFSVTSAVRRQYQVMILQQEKCESHLAGALSATRCNNRTQFPLDIFGTKNHARRSAPSRAAIATARPSAPAIDGMGVEAILGTCSPASHRTIPPAMLKTAPTTSVEAPIHVNTRPRICCIFVR